MSLMRHFDCLESLRDQLEARRLLRATSYSSDDKDVNDRTIGDLKDRIFELSAEISILRYSAC